jgi:hypothetical protein
MGTMDGSVAQISTGKLSDDARKKARSGASGPAQWYSRMRQPVYHSAAVENSCLFHTLKLESAPILEYYNPRWARLFADLGCTAFAADPPR